MALWESITNLDYLAAELVNLDLIAIVILLNPRQVDMDTIILGMSESKISREKSPMVEAIKMRIRTHERVKNIEQSPSISDIKGHIFVEYVFRNNSVRRLAIWEVSVKHALPVWRIKPIGGHLFKVMYSSRFIKSVRKQHYVVIDSSVLNTRLPQELDVKLPVMPNKLGSIIKQYSRVLNKPFGNNINVTRSTCKAYAENTIAEV